MDITSPLTGVAQTGLTSPTYTLADDTPPASNSKQWYVTALGGTQTGVSAHSVGRPFTLSVFAPAKAKTPTSGVLSEAGLITNIPKNQNKVITRKSIGVNSVGGYGIMNLSTSFDVPVNGPETDLVSIKAAISAHIGALEQSLDQWYTAIESGAL
jgi:hypothetical protein